MGGETYDYGKFDASYGALLGHVILGYTSVLCLSFVIVHDIILQRSRYVYNNLLKQLWCVYLGLQICNCIISVIKYQYKIDSTFYWLSLWTITTSFATPIYLLSFTMICGLYEKQSRSLLKKLYKIFPITCVCLIVFYWAVGLPLALTKGVYLPYTPIRYIQSMYVNISFLLLISAWIIIYRSKYSQKKIFNNSIARSTGHGHGMVSQLHPENIKSINPSPKNENENEKAQIICI